MVLVAMSALALVTFLIGLSLIGWLAKPAYADGR